MAKIDRESVSDGDEKESNAKKRRREMLTRPAPLPHCNEAIRGPPVISEAFRVETCCFSAIPLLDASYLDSTRALV